ncbi:tripartite tricarboxylate transporter TctB family protein (plasmid) [Salipiger sp. H15]|uniref:Tripartite tricarboxylate transporter TctB family protein n=1 Tax=Alloyangia sp. H15 TaxID=3029062 RepID=A0AAU8ARY3_9RHOB
MTPSRLKGIAPTLVLLALCAVYYATGASYGAATRAIPLAVCAVTILLLGLDLLSQGDGRLSVLLRRALGGARALRPGAGGHEAGVGREIAAFAWIAAFALLAVVLGFYISIPVYVIAYLRLHAGKPLATAALIGLVLTGVLYLLFAVLLGYDIFEGLVFGGYM